MYIAVLFIHSWLRYLVLALGIWVLFASVSGMRAEAEGDGAGAAQRLQRAQVTFLAVLDVQLLLGLLLYFVISPIAAAARANMGAAMKNPELRFFGVEHIFTMLIAIVIAHVGRARSKRKQGSAKFRSALIMQCIWLLLTLLAIPWPGLDIARPLFR